MDVKEIKVEAQLRLGRPISTQTLFRYINDGMRNVCTSYPNACKTLTKEIQAKQNVWYDLDAGLIQIRNVEDNAGIKRKWFEVLDNKIKFDVSDTYTLEMNVLPANVRNETDVPELKAIFHSSLSYYVAFMERQRLFGISDKDAYYLEQRFIDEAEKANLSLKKIKGGSIIIKAPRW